MLENISSRKLNEEDWQIFRDLRLKALKAMPSIFITTHAEEAKVSEEEWKTRLSTERGSLFGLFDADRLVGITGSFRWLKSPEDTVLFGMSYIEPEYRNQGLSKMIYAPRFAWARAQSGIDRIIIGHREGNEASKAAILKWGFRFYEKEEITFGDGSRAYDHRYELNLV